MPVGLTVVRRLPRVEQTRREHADLRGTLVTNQVDLAVPAGSLNNSHRTDRPVHRVCGRNVIAIR